MQIDSRDGYLFRSTDKHGRVSNNPFIGSSIAAHLKTHFSHLGIADGETMHSFRSGCSITLSMLDASIEDIATHVGWRSTESAQYYTQTDKVLGLANSADLLARSTNPMASSHKVPEASRVADTFRSHNDLNNYRLAFE